jgi:mono/diheme cytochrome c family protein
VNAIRYVRLVALIFAASSLLSSLLVPEASGQAPGGDPEKGKALFAQNCVNCDGLDATGEDGPNLHGVPAALGDVIQPPRRWSLRPPRQMRESFSVSTGE